MNNHSNKPRFLELAPAISQFQTDGKSTDLTLVCEGVHFPVPRVLLCAQSRVLRDACEVPSKEVSSSVYVMNEDSLPMVRRMVRFFYEGTYGTSTKFDVGCDSPSGLQIHARMFAMGVEYDVPRLRELALIRFSTRLKSFSTDSDVLECVADVYRLTLPSGRPLREILVKKARPRLQEYVRASLREKFKLVSVETPEFLMDVLDAVLEAPIVDKCFACEKLKPLIPTCAVCSECGIRTGFFDRAPLQLLPGSGPRHSKNVVETPRV